MTCFPLRFSCTSTIDTFTLIWQHFSSGDSDEFLFCDENFARRIVSSNKVSPDRVVFSAFEVCQLFTNESGIFSTADLVHKKWLFEMKYECLKAKQITLDLFFCYSSLSNLTYCNGIFCFMSMSSFVQKLWLIWDGTYPTNQIFLIKALRNEICSKSRV